MTEKSRTSISKFLQFTAFSILFIISFWFMNRIFILKRWDGITPMQNLYAQKKNSIDVLLIGPSLIGLGLDTDELWYEYGIAAYNLWGSVQPFWNTYYNLKEVLKSQKPKVAILEVSPASYDFEYQDDARQLCNTNGMRLSVNFIKSVIVSTQKERILEVLFGIRTFHSRFKDLSSDDFKHFSWNENCKIDKGGGYHYFNKKMMDLTDIS